MKRMIPAIITALTLCLLIPFGLLYTASRPPATDTGADTTAEIMWPSTIFDGEELYTDGRWYLLSDGRLADLSDGRVYATDLDFLPFDRIETDGERLYADGIPFLVYRTKVYPKLGALNAEYETLRARFPDAPITVVSTFHMATVVSGNLYMFTDDGTLSVVRVEWGLYGESSSLFEQICLFYEYPNEFSGNDRYYILDGGNIRCFNIMFGELGMP